MDETAFLCAFLAGLLDVGANLASTKSKGFSHRAWGLLSILLVLGAFGLLAQASRTIHLPVAYAILGATGIFGTAICGRFLFKQRLKPISWLGFAMVLAAIIVLHSAGGTGVPSVKIHSQRETTLPNRTTAVALETHPLLSFSKG